MRGSEREAAWARRSATRSAGCSGVRGPEVFRPAGAGSIESATSAPVTVNLRLDGGAPDLLRSEAQIAQMLARAVALGSRRM